MSGEPTPKYESLEEITDNIIKEAFTKAVAVQFLAKNFNYVQFRKITFGNLGWWLPLERVLPIIGITPQMLRPVFNPQKAWEEGKLVEIKLPEIIESYGQLGAFTCNVKPLQELAKVFGKAIEVFKRRSDSLEDLDCEHVATVFPSGKVVNIQNEK